MADAGSEAAGRTFDSCLGLTIKYLFGLLELIRRITDVGQTLDGPGRSRGRGPGLLTPAGLASSYHQRRTSSRIWDAFHES